MIAPVYYIWLGLFLFSIGAFGVIFRRNFLFVLMSLELMMNSVGLVLIGVSLEGYFKGQLVILMVLGLAAGEVALGIAILLAMFRLKKDLNLDNWNLLGSHKKGVEQ